LAALAQPFRDDQTNADLTRTRARIRHELLPKLAVEYNPNIALALVRLGALAAALERSTRAGLEALERSAVLNHSPDCIVLEQASLRSAPPFLRAELLRRLWRRAGWPEVGMSQERWGRLAALVQHDDPARIDVGARIAASTDGSLVELR